jgi:large subunit ribosomal protein L25
MLLPGYEKLGFGVVNRMKLSVFSRAFGKKSELTKIRLEGGIPAVFYGSKRSAKNIFIKADEFQTILRNLKPGLLATTVFELSEGKESFRAIIKDVQYHPVSYSVLHIDFFELEENSLLALNVPIQIAGVADCVGVKLGGFVRQVIRSLKVACLPKDMPTEFMLDITQLELTQSMRLSDIKIPSGVKPLAKMNEIAVVITKKA